MESGKSRNKSNWQRWGLITILISSVIGLTGCNGGSSSTVQTTSEKVTITGSVEGTASLPDVKVSAGGVVVTSDSNGLYLLEDVPVPTGGQLVLTYEKDGYATFQRSLPVVDGETYSVVANLLLFHYSEIKDATTQQDINILDPGNPDPANPLAEITFPANSIANNGSVTINVGVGDPTTPEGSAVFPGDYMAAATAGGEVDTPLESIAFTEITIVDDQGTEITTLTEPATLTVRLPDSLQTEYAANDTIPWWSYDEISASWIREDANPATAELDDALVIDLRGDGVLYAQAQITHMSWWNVDQPIDEHSCLCTTIVAADGSPLVNELLIGEGITYNGVSRPAATDSTGRACVTVKRSSSNVTEQIKLYSDRGGIRFYYDVTDENEGDVTSNQIFTPTIAGSTIRSSGECVDLANTITAAFTGEINGTVSFEGSATPVSDFTIYSNYGETATTNANGQYTLKAPVGIPVILYAVGQANESVTVLNASTPVTVDFILPNLAPVIESLTRVPEGTVNNSETVVLTVTASDPEGAALNYAWSANTGTFNQANTASVNWSAPASGIGTATLTLTVTDDKGAQTSQNILIVYQQPVTVGTSFSLIIKDDPLSDQPMAGVIVALYATDNVTITSTIVSDANGLVDFGDVGSNRVTFTVAYESASSRGIESFIDVPATKDVVYYIEEDEIETANKLVNINLGLSQLPSDASVTRVQPVSGFFNHDSGSGFLTDLSLFDTYLQDDGNLTLLALTSDSSQNLVKWGMLENQTFIEGATYTVNITQDPVTKGWSTSTATPLTSIAISGYRQGVEYTLATDFSFDPKLGSAGSLQFPVGFPVDRYTVAGSVVDVDFVNSVGSIKNYTTLPQTFEVPIPDYSFSNVNFNASTGVLSWALSGSSPRDLVSISIVGQDFNTDWDISLSPSRTSWKVMELPAPANTWLDTSSLEGNINSISIQDLDFVNGTDELWNFLITGGDFEVSAGVLLFGSTSLNNNDFAQRPATTATSDGSNQNRSRSISRLPGDSLSGLRRR